MKELFEIISFSVLMMLALLGAFIGVSAAYSYLVVAQECKTFAEMSGYETYYSLPTNCLVKRNGEWVKWEVVVKNKQEITIKTEGK